MCPRLVQSPDDLRPNVHAFDDQPAGILAVVFLPAGLTALVVQLLNVSFASPDDIVGFPEEYVAYGLANLAVLVALYALLDEKVWAAVSRFGETTRSEVLAALGAFVGSLVLFRAVTVANAALGIEIRWLEYALTDPVAVTLMVGSAVLVIPLVEEVLFRGVFLGYLLNQGLSPVLAGGVTVLAFTLVQVPHFGGGALYVLVWAALPTALRLRYDGLTGAWLMHALHNGYVFVLIAGLVG